MCFFARAAASTCARCLECGVARITACTFASASTSSNEVPMAILCSTAKSRTVSGSSVTPRTKLIGAPKSRAAFTRVLPHQPRPTIAVLSMRSSRRGRAGLLHRMRAREGVVRHAGVDDALDGREWRQIDLEIRRARRLPGKTNVGDGDLVALTVALGLLRAGEIGFQRLQGLHVPMVTPFQHASLVDLVFMRQVFAHPRYDQRMGVAGDDLRQAAHPRARLRLLRQ